MEVMCVVTLDKVNACLEAPHPICVEVGIFHVPVEGWIIDLDIDCLPDGLGDAMCLLA